MKQVQRRAAVKLVLVPLLALGVASCAVLKPVPVTPPPAPAALPPAAPPSPVAIPLAPPPSLFPPAPRAEQPYFIQEGIASFYGGTHQGKRTATGEHFNRADFTAAHPSLPFGTVVRVTNLHNGMMVKVRINDRGPHVKGRVIDLSTASARALGIWDGLARVQIEAFATDQLGAFPP